jgi:hypothetical protein
METDALPLPTEFELGVWVLVFAGEEGFLTLDLDLDFGLFPW